MSWLTSPVNYLKAGTTALKIANPVSLASGALYATTGGRIGSDITPGYSANNVLQTQFNGPAIGTINQPKQTKTDGDLPSTDTGQITSTYNGSGSASGRNASGYYGNYTSDQVNAINGQLSQTDRLLASLGITQDVGLQNLNNEYGKNVGRAQEGQAQFNRDLNIRRTDNQNNKLNSLNRINTDAENKFNSVMRMLGIKGSGVSSAAQMVAPHLVAQNASNQRADQFDTFGRNQRSIDTAATDSELKYKNLFEDLMGQKTSKENDLRQSIINQQNDILGTKAKLRAQLDAANGGTGAAAYQDYNDSLGRNQITLDQLLRESVAPQYNVKAVDTAAPNLDQYTADPLATFDPNAQDPTASEVNAYLPWLQRKEKLGLY